MKFPDKEFSEGYTCKFSTKDTHKSLPANVNIIYPKSWLAVAGDNRTNIIENFISGYGLGSVSMALSMEISKTNYTKDQLTLLLSKENMQKTLQSGSKVTGYETDFTIDNCKAAAITYCSEKKEEDLKEICFVNKKYSCYYKNAILSLSFSILSSDCDDVNKEFRKYQKLMKRITDNIVILSQWGQ